MLSAATSDASFDLAAARLAAAMLRFQEPLASLMKHSTPAGQPELGVDCYAFMPYPKRVLREDLPAFLASLPSAVMLAPTIIRGIVSISLLEELSPDRRTSMQHDLDNQQSIFGDVVPMDASDGDRVLLEFDDESHQFSLGAVRLWAGRYGILVGWNLAPCEDRDRADWRINLIGGDGKRRSKGGGDGLR